MKPSTALLKDNKPFYYPDFTKNLHYEGELVLRIGKNGKHITEKFASNYIDAITIGLDLTARDLQQKLKDKGLPWEKSKAFDFSAPIGKFVAYSGYLDRDISFNLLKNNEGVQAGNTDMMLFNFHKLIAHISIYFTLQKGDLIFTGTPAGVGPVQIGDVFEGCIEGQKLFSCKVK